MKQTGICPKCNSNKIGVLENVIQRTEAMVEGRTAIGHCQAPVGIERTQSGGLIKVTKEGPVGKLEAYICTSCGFYETYIKDPANLQYERIVGFKWVNQSS